MSQYGTLSADGNTDQFKVSGNEGVWIHLDGDFGGGTIITQFLSLDGVTWHPIVDSDKTDDDDFKIEIPHGVIIRCNLAGATNPTVNWEFRSTTVRN